MRADRDPQADGFGAVELAGVEYLPEEARDSHPANVFAVFLGANLGWTTIIFGYLAVVFGLSFWDTVTSFGLGTLLGALLTAPLALYGPRTGTNMTVSSGAAFGIRGRFVGTALALAFALVFAAITVWTSGDAIVAAGHRLLGTPDSDLATALAYAVIAVEMVTVALYGHATIVAMQKFVIPVVGLVLVAGLFVFAGDFHPGARSGGYELGGYWPTWMLIFVIGVAGPVSYASNIGDYTRRISGTRFSDRQVVGWTAAGLFLGLVLPTLFGAFTASSIELVSDDYLADLVAGAPAWYSAAIVVVAVLGGLGQGVLCVYASGLDLETLVPRSTRLHTTIVTSALATVLLYLGVFVFDAADAATAISVLLNAFAVPWVAILLVDILRHRTSGYDPVDLQAFADRRHGGRYWFTGGFSVPALAAWVAGTVFGLLCANTTLYVGPVANAFGGVDPTVGGGILTVAVYLVASRLAPRPTPARASDPAPAEVSA